LNVGDNYTIGPWTYSLWDASSGGVLLQVYNSSGLQETAPVTTTASIVLPNANVSIVSVYQSANATLNFTYVNNSCTITSALLSIQLQTPVNGSTTTVSTPQFVFNVSGPDSTYSCTLYVDNSNDGSNLSVQNNTQTTITSTNVITSGSHNYYVGCSGNSVNVSGVSQTNSFTQSSPQILITLLNPASYSQLWTQNGVTSNWPVLFNFSAQGPDASYNCILDVDGVSYSLPATNNTVTPINEGLNVGTHSYNVSCSNGSLTGTSETYDFYLNSPNLVITLIYPVNQQTLSSSYYNVPFNFTASGSDFNYSCGLYFESCYWSSCSYNLANSTIAQNTAESTILYNFNNLHYGLNNYTINCTGITLTSLENGSAGQFIK
jgi:hypothetical protein